MKFKDIKPGMLIFGKGLVLSVNDAARLYEGVPHMSYIDYNDASLGACSCEMDENEDYELFAEQYTQEYYDVLRSLMRELMDQQTEIGSLAAQVLSYSADPVSFITDEEEEDYDNITPMEKE